MVILLVCLQPLPPILNRLINEESDVWQPLSTNCSFAARINNIQIQSDQRVKELPGKMQQKNQNQNQQKPSQHLPGQLFPGPDLPFCEEIPAGVQ